MITSDTDSDVAPFIERRARKAKAVYDPRITLGNIATIVSLVVILGGAFGKYSSDQEKQDGRLSSLEKNQDADKKEVKDSLNKIEVTVSKMQDSLATLDKNVAVLNAKTPPSK